MGKYEMAVPIAKELLRKGYVVPKDPIQKLNYNCRRRDEIRSKKDINFLFVKENTASSSVKQSSTCVATVTKCNICVPSSQSKSIFSVDAGHNDESEDLNDSFGFAVSDESA